MKILRLTLLLVAFVLFTLLLLGAPAWADDLVIDQAKTFALSVDPAADCDSLPTISIYEDGTDTAILAATNMTKLDDAGTDGLYDYQYTISAANGFEVGKSYTVRYLCVLSGLNRQPLESYAVVGDAYARLGAPAGASVSADLAAVKTETALIYAAVDTEIGSIKTKTDFLPSATAGAAGGLFIAGTNAATTITTALTTTFTGNLTGSVGSVTGAVGSVTASVNLPAIPADWITAAGIAPDAIGASELAAGAITSSEAPNLNATISGLPTRWQTGFYGTVTVAGSPAATTTSFASTTFSSTNPDGYVGFFVECPDASAFPEVTRFDPATDTVFIHPTQACPTAFTGTVNVWFKAVTTR